jgi:hypothetical protein
MAVYLIKPLEKKSVVFHAEMYRKNEDGTISWFNIDETFRWGQGFIEEDMDCNLPFDDDNIAYCDPSAGWGAELDDCCSCWFEYSDDISDEEKEAIESAYHEGGAGWLFDGEHDWQEEDSAIHVLGPFTVSLVEEDGTVIEENVKLRNREKVIAEYKKNSNWPFGSTNEE